MKKYLKFLFFTFVLTMIFAVPTFADITDLFPVSMNYGTGNIIFGSQKTVENPGVNLKNGDVIKEINVPAINGLKTTFQIKTRNGNTVKWNQSGTKKSWTDNENLYYSLSVTPKKNTVYCATISHGSDKVKVNFKITSVVEPSENNVAPSMTQWQLASESVNNVLDTITNSYSNDRLWQYNENSFLFKPKNNVTNKFNGANSDATINISANSKIDLIVRAVDGVKFKWSKTGKVTTKNGISINRITPSKSETIYCTVSCGSIKVNVPFCVKVNNKLSIVNTKNKSQEESYQSTHCCKGDHVNIAFGIKGLDIKKITVKAKDVKGKNVNYVLGKTETLNSENTNYRTVSIRYSPTASYTSVFTISDQYGSSFDVSCHVEVGDHKYTIAGSVRKKPTVTNEGSQYMYCSVCKKSRTTITLPKLPAIIKVPATYKIKIGKKEQVDVTLSTGDYITNVTATKNGKTTIIKVTKKSNSFYVQGVNAGTSEVTIKTKAGKTAKCKVTAY